MYIFSVSGKNHFKNSWTILIYLVGFTCLPFYMISKYGPTDTYVFIQYAIIGFSIFFIPQLILHLNYYFKNKGDVFSYDPDGKTITIEYKGISHQFYFDDIELVERYKSRPLAEERMQIFPWDSYNFSIINLKGGRRFLITSLLVPNMDLPIPSSKVKLKKTFYRLASLDTPYNSQIKKYNQIPDTFKRTLSKKSDEEIQNIISSDQGAYDKLFIEAARQELKNRS